MTLRNTPYYRGNENQNEHITKRNNVEVRYIKEDRNHTVIFSILILFLIGVITVGIMNYRSDTEKQKLYKEYISLKKSENTINETDRAINHPNIQQTSEPTSIDLTNMGSTVLENPKNKIIILDEKLSQENDNKVETWSKF